MIANGIGAKNIGVIPAGVGTFFFRPLDEPRVDFDFRVGFVRSLTDEKGVGLLLELIEKAGKELYLP